MTAEQDDQPVVALGETMGLSEKLLSGLLNLHDEAEEAAVGPVVDLSEPEPEPESDQAPVVALGDDEDETEVAEDDSASPVTVRIEKSYSSKEVAKSFFGKSEQWLYWGLRDKDGQGNDVEPVFVYEDGSRIEPLRRGKRMRWTLPMIKEMAAACYRRGNLKEDSLKAVLAKIEAAQRDELVLT